MMINLIKCISKQYTEYRQRSRKMFFFKFQIRSNPGNFKFLWNGPKNYKSWVCNSNVCVTSSTYSWCPQPQPWVKWTTMVPLNSPRINVGPRRSWKSSEATRKSETARLSPEVSRPSFVQLEMQEQYSSSGDCSFCANEMVIWLQ